MNSIKVLQVIDILNPGGAERVFVDVCNILQNNSIDVSALFLLEGGILKPELNPEICTFELNRESKWSLGSMQKCSKIISRFSVIHCHFRHVYRYIVLVSKLFSIKSKIILHDHFGAIEIDKSVPFLFQSIFKPKYYIGVSDSLTNWATNNLSIPAKNVFVLQNIIIKKEYNNDAEIRADLILVSNIKPIKNNIFAIKVANAISEKLLLIGKNQNNSYFEELEEESSKSNVTILNNINNPQQYMKNAKLGLHTSISESGPLVLIEYLAQGLPFLAYETGEVAKILKPHFPEYFIDNFEVENWVEKIKFIKETKIDSQKMNSVFNQNFGVETYFNKLQLIYICITKN
jgi:glycosyltransferase involved in cell wall biosynthesis